jgi:hypothetical protein
LGNEFWAAIAGAIVGATVGGIISYCLQRQSLGAAVTQRDKDALFHQQTLARSFVVKLSILYSHLGQMDRHMQGIFARIAAQPDPKPEAWQIAVPVAPLPSLVHFSTDELTLLLTLKLDDLFNAAAMMDEIHNNAVALFETFNAKKEALNSLITPEAFTGMVGHIALTQDQVRVVRPKMLEINQLVDAMRGHTDRGAKESFALLSSVVAGFNDKLRLKLSVVPAQPAAADTES